MTDNIKEVCNSALDYMDKLSPSIMSLCEQIKEYDLSGIEVLGGITEGLKWLAGAVSGIECELGIDIKDDAEALFSQIRDIGLSLENGDYLFLSDILEFDVMPGMENIFNNIRDALAA